MDKGPSKGVTEPSSLIETPPLPSSGEYELQLPSRAAPTRLHLFPANTDLRVAPKQIWEERRRFGSELSAGFDVVFHSLVVVITGGVVGTDIREAVARAPLHFGLDRYRARYHRGTAPASPPSLAPTSPTSTSPPDPAASSSPPFLSPFRFFCSSRTNKETYSLLFSLHPTHKDKKACALDGLRQILHKRKVGLGKFGLKREWA